MKLFDSQVNGAKNLYESKEGKKRFNKAVIFAYRNGSGPVRKILSEFGTTAEIYAEYVEKAVIQMSKNELDKLRAEVGVTSPLYLDALKTAQSKHQLDQLRTKFEIKATTDCEG